MLLRPRDTLQFRLITLVVVFGLLSLLLHLAVTAILLDGFSKQFSMHMVSRAQLSRALLSQAAPAQRDSLAADLRNSGTRVLRQTAPVPPAEDVAWPDGPLENLLAVVPSDMQVSMVHTPPNSALMARPTIQFAFEVDGEPWLLEQTLTPPELALASTILGWPVMIALSVMAAMLMGVRLIGRPLQDTIKSLGSLGGPQASLGTISVPDRASAEVVQLVHAFNELVHAVSSADAAKRQLLAGVSHDLRTPLARLRLRIETQCEDDLGPARSAQLYADLDALERIVGQFLAFVQGQDDDSALGFMQPTLPLVRKVMDAYAAEDVRLLVREVDEAFELPDLALQRILRNLIDNALTHGTPPVVVELCARRLTVWDAGRGISEGEFNTALQPFVRLQPRQPDAGLRRPASCGLGLAIVAQLAQHTGAQLKGRRSSCTDAVGAGCFGVEVAW
jgi:two-component system, OmpR family, osmolarity sensor histidine kinase EnvZ